MVFTLLYVLLAAFGLGVLIFIHEFGHYWMARRKGMEVEVFSIGFGKPFFSWKYQGVKWFLWKKTVGPHSSRACMSLCQYRFWLSHFLSPLPSRGKDEIFF